MTPTNEQIEELQALLEAATPAPWKIKWDYGDQDDAAELIISLRNAAPDLLSELLQLRKENERLRKAAIASLPVIEYIRANGWDEAPPIGWSADEVKAYELLTAALTETENTK